MSEAPGLPGNELVFKGSRSSRKYLLYRAITALVLAVLVVLAGEFLQPHIVVIAGYLIGLFAVGNAAAYALDGLYRTALTSEGIEVRGYVRRVIPWSDVRAFRVRGLDRPGLLSPDPGSARQIEPRKLEPSAGEYGNLSVFSLAGRTRARRVTVEVVRTNGRRVRLPAPIVAGPHGDSEFPDKVRQMEQWRQQRVGWESAPLA